MLERVTSRFSVENFLSGSIEKLRIRTLLCFTKFLVPKKFMEKRGRREGVSRVSVNFFLSQCRKKIVGESYSVSLISGIEKSYV